MDILSFIQLFVLAFVIESLVEYLLGQAFERLAKSENDVLSDIGKQSWLLMYVSAGVGVLFTVIYKVDIFPQIMLEGSVFGQVVTGLLIGRGSNFVNDLYSKFRQKPPEWPEF